MTPIPPSVVRFFLISLLLICSAPAAITVIGIADEDIDTDQAAFTVPSEAGFTIVANLNGVPVALDSSTVVTTPGYYELGVTKTNDSDASKESVVIQFIVLDSTRGTSERGLVNWIPYPTIDSAPSAYAGMGAEVIAPAALPMGYDIPLVVRLFDPSSVQGLRLNGTMIVPEMPGSFVRVLRGFGSSFLPAPATSGALSLTPTINGIAVPKSILIESVTTWTVVSSDITQSVDWGQNARISITADLAVSDGVTLTIGEGSIIQLDPGVDIQLDGTLDVNGSDSAPVLFSNAPGQNPWGGFFLQGVNSSADVEHAIFTGSGADSDWFSGSGYSAHRKEQATFLVDDSPAIFTNCYFLDLEGQALHGKDATISVSDCIVQRVPTVGQFNGGAVTVTRSALIEFPKNDNIFNDDDNDGIYFTEGSHQLIDSVVGWAKDDGVDAGSGDSGSVVVDGCWFEACYHEGMAWSGGGRTADVIDSLAMNCGQGIEAGWSTGSNSPIVTVTGSLCVGNHIGWRYGDNYDWDYDGQLNVSNSASLYNDRNIFGYEWDSWNYRSERMTIENNQLSEADGRHPTNALWDHALAATVMATYSASAGSEVGCGFGEWSFQRDISEYGGEIVLSVSEPGAQPVAITYEVARDFEVIATGSVQLHPGELRKSLSLPALGGVPQSFVRVTLTGSTGSEITTPRNLFYLVPPQVDGSPQTLIAKGSAWRYLDDGSNQGDAWKELSFDDSGWAEDSAELGYGDGDEAKVVNDLNASGNLIATTYFRHEFTVNDPSQFGTLDLNLLRDDGAIVYLNGEEEFRSNIDAGLIAFDTFTENVTQGSEEDLYFTKEIPASKLQAGTNVIAVEVHQANDTSSDISFNFELVAHPIVPATLLLLESGDEINLLWQGDSGIILQSSTTLDADWADVPGATSPLRLTPGEPDPWKFFRLAR